MKALVVYESMYGNTRHVAEAIAMGIGEDAVAIEVGHAPNVIPGEVELLVVGGPTHVHGMSRSSTRESAAARVNRSVISKIGIRDWLETLRLERPIVGATFDTRIDGMELLTGSAAKGAAKLLRSRGCRVESVASFVLNGEKGDFDRVNQSEIERARDFGRSLESLLPVLA
jgi:hypothetical protein